MWQCFPGNHFRESDFADLYIPRDWDPNWTVKKIQPHSPQKSFTDHRRREWSRLSPEKGVIITFPISVSIVFLNVQQTFTAGQPGMSSIKITRRDDIFQPTVLSFVWAKQKWKFLRDPPYAALPLARACRSLAIHRELASRLGKTPISWPTINYRLYSDKRWIETHRSHLESSQPM